VSFDAFPRTLLLQVHSTPELRAIFDEERLLERWLAIEVALAEAQAELGLIPPAAAATIREHATLGRLDREAIFRNIAVIEHPLVPLLRELAAACGPAGGHLHWGATTQDIVDTGLVLQLRDALVVVRRDLDLVVVRSRALARRHRDTVMAARTHGQHALPTTFGYKVALWLAEIERHVDRLDALEPRVLVGQLAGAVGTYAGFGSAGREVERATLARLGLAAPDAPWHTSRDGLAELVFWAAMLGATLGKIAAEIATLQRTEVAELEEPFPVGAVGSSTMPHKRNPLHCEGVVSAATLLRGAAVGMLAAMGHQHERDGAPWNVELSCVPQAVCLIGAALAEMAYILGGLTVRPARMRANVDLLGGMIMSEALMLELARDLGRERAHDVVYEAAMDAHATGRRFTEVLGEHGEISARLSREALEALLQPERYLGLGPTLVDEIAGRDDTPP
jgi:adenylosuccinate lyase